MLRVGETIGANDTTASFPDIIMNMVSSVSDGSIQGFASFVHDPKTLEEHVKNFAKQSVATDFTDAVIQRRSIANNLDKMWKFGLNMETHATCPMPWSILESKAKYHSGTEWQFPIMRNADFIGRNFLRITLPEMNTKNVHDSYVSSGTVPALSDPKHTYLGAWHNNLIPRLIEELSFCTRQNTHVLYKYSGFDIYLHNILFGNQFKEMNDLAAGEDKFELCYDPYVVDSSALGIGSYKGIDTYTDWAVKTEPVTSGGSINAATEHEPTAQITGSPDGFIDYLCLDTTMDDAEFRDAYRHNVWYESPVARNYNIRHSIHEHRMYHQAKEITIPLDILPFGYSMSSSLPTAALATECGYFGVKLFSDWLDRCFYLTPASNIATRFIIPQHTHYEHGNATPEGTVLGTADPRIGWVNERSIGRYGDPSFAPASTAGDDEAVPFSMPGSVIGADVNLRDNIVPTTVTPVEGQPSVYKTNKGPLPTTTAQIKRNAFATMRAQSTSVGLSSLARSTPLTDSDSSTTAFVHKPSMVDQSFYTTKAQEIQVKLLQIGYQTLRCVREYFTKLPNIYLTTEWSDQMFNDGENIHSRSQIKIQNDKYIQALTLWFIPEDANGVESMRLNVHDAIDHENPIVAGIEMYNENSQGKTVLSWNELNILTPQTMHLNPLQENIGIISFTPEMKPNDFPYAFYDVNLGSALVIDIKKGDNVNYNINLKKGKLLATTIGLNGVALANMTMFRLIF